MNSLLLLDACLRCRGAGNDLVKGSKRDSQFGEVSLVQKPENFAKKKLDLGSRLKAHAKVLWVPNQPEIVHWEFLKRGVN